MYTECQGMVLADKLGGRRGGGEEREKDGEGERGGERNGGRGRWGEN